MSELSTFIHPDFGTVRTVARDNQTWFVAMDVCLALDLGNSRMATARLDADEKGVSSIDTPGGRQEMTVINEPGLYSLVMVSRKPEARAFKRWITHEVLPAIRQQGFYGTEQAIERMLADPAAAIQMLQAYQLEQSRRRLLEVQAERNAPKVLFADSVAASEHSILIGELAKLMKQNGVEVGQNRLFEWLRRDGFLIKNGESRNMPSQYSMENGWMEIKERTISNPDGSIRLTRTPKVTGRGQQYFINRYLKALAGAN
ncbi:MAG: phage antirepressor Ant [Clostridiales bacterium]|nr:phage antirepressor Ant [Clostridiales bacterium]